MDVDCGDVFVVDVSRVTSEGNGDEDTSSCLPQRLAEGDVSQNGVRGGRTRSSLFPSCRVTFRELTVCSELCEVSAASVRVRFRRAVRFV